METTAKGHGGGDPLQVCERLTVRAKTVSDARKLARLNRVLSNAELRERLFELAERLEAEARPETEWVGC